MATAIKLGDCEINLDGPGDNTLIAYSYVDASNYKAFNEVILAGRITEEQLAVIAQALNDGWYFVPGQIGLDDIQNYESTCWYPDLDHIWHRFDRIEYTGRKPRLHDGDNQCLAVAELIANFVKLNGKWDTEYKPDCYDDMVAAYEEYQAEEGADGDD